MITSAYFPSDQVAYYASEYINSLLLKYMRQPVLLMLSGGSSFSILNFFHAEKLSSHVLISVLDERYSNDPAINNFSILSHTEFYRIALLRGCQFIDTRLRDDYSQLLIARYMENELRKWKYHHPHGKVIITQGIGLDGHTAGIMPYPSHPMQFRHLFENDFIWVESYDAWDRNEFPKRITVTFPFLREVVDHAVVYVTGEEKRGILQTVLSRPEINECPAAIIHEMKDVKIFTDVRI